jgi:hypothetical protein
LENKPPPSPWDRWAPWGFGAAVLILGLLIWEWFPPGIWHDDGAYVLLGRALANGEGLRYLGISGDFLAPKFPPLFPLLLALVWSVAPSFPDNATLLSGVNLLLLGVGAGLFLAYLRRVFQLSLPIAFAASALAWLSPSLWRLAMVPLSEPLFIVMLILALWMGARLERGGGKGTLLLFLLAASLAFHARTMGVVVLLGCGAALLLRGRRKDSLLTLGGGVALALPWVLWSRSVARAIPAPLQDTLGPYGGWLAEEFTRDPLAYLAFVSGNALNLLGRVLAVLLPGVHGPILWLGIVLLPVLFLGFWEMGKKSAVLPLTVGAALGILLLWPFQDVRLLLPFQPFLILGVVVGFRSLLFSGALSLRGRVPISLVGGGWVILVLSVSLFRLGTGWPGEPYRVRSEALAKAARAVNEKTPPNAVIGAPELWSGISLFTGRIASPSARFRPLASGGPSWGTPQEQYELWLEAGVTHILVEHGGGVHGDAMDRLDALCPEGTIQVLDLQPGQFLVKLAWDRSCQMRVLAPD